MEEWVVVLWRSEWWFYGGVSGGSWRSGWWFYGGVSGGFMEE